jgi:hypothetical protein
MTVFYSLFIIYSEKNSNATLDKEVYMLELSDYLGWIPSSVKQK